jgi:hypothetical protein
MRADAPAKNPLLRRPLARGLISAIAALTIAIAVAACGGGGASPGVANVGHSPSAGHSGSPSSSSGTPASGGVGESTTTNHTPGGNTSGFSFLVGNTADALKFSQCMRANGETNFPDPNASGVIQGSSSRGLDPNSPQFQRAQSKCQKYMGKGPALSAGQKAQALAQLLKYSECMRAHGASDFPDPTTAGGGVGLHLKVSPGSDLDPNSPIFQRAQRDCSSLPGAPKQRLGAGPGSPP